MPNNRTTTAADAILYISVDPIFPVAQRIQGFSADDVTNMDQVVQTETSMGVDGRLSAGWTPAAITQNFVLQADSLSNDFFDTWQQLQQQGRTAYVATGSLIYPSTGKKYAMTRGFLNGLKVFPDAKRTLQARPFSIIWERVTLAPS